MDLGAGRSSPARLTAMLEVGEHAEGGKRQPIEGQQRERPTPASPRQRRPSGSSSNASGTEDREAHVQPMFVTVATTRQNQPSRFCEWAHASRAIPAPVEAQHPPASRDQPIRFRGR